MKILVLKRGLSVGIGLLGLCCLSPLALAVDKGSLGVAELKEAYRLSRLMKKRLQQGNQEMLDQGKRLEAGDYVSIVVLPQKDLSYDTRVDEDGSAYLPYLGKVKAGGLTLEEFRDQLKKMLEEKHFKNPQVVVTKRSAERSEAVDVLGEVQSPGPVEVKKSSKRPMTLIRAISQAGGFTKTAALNKVQIIRLVGGRPTTIRVRAGNILKAKEKDVILEEGDIVIVPEGFW